MCLLWEKNCFPFIREDQIDPAARKGEEGLRAQSHREAQIEILNHDLCKSKKGIHILIISNEQIHKLVQFLKSAKGMH